MPSLTLKLCKLVGVLALLNLIAINLVSADPPWPTPPPAPQAPIPQFEENITPIEVPPVPGAASALIHPIPQGMIPSIPPLKSTVFEVPEHIKITVEAGALDRTIQLTYVPLVLNQIPTEDQRLGMVRAFDLRSFDHSGLEVQLTLRRPFLLEVPVNRLPGPTPDPNALLFARFEEGRWLPLVTSYFHEDGILMARILKPGRFAIIQDPRSY